MPTEERVVLLDAEGAPAGSAPKHEVHTVDTPLHLAFSCYVLDHTGRVLLTRRSLSKQTWPGVWTNSFCGHPSPGEDPADAVRRRGRQELGIEVQDVRLALRDFAYRAVDASGIVENEVCPVFLARLSASSLRPDPAEVMDHAWLPVERVRTLVRDAPMLVSPWMALQVARWETFRV